MDKIKQVNTLIDQICSDMHEQPPINLYSDVLAIIESRVDMPKHSVAAISKKLTSKSKKAVFIAFDILEYLSYNLQLPFFSQIATKQFLFKISGLMMNKETDPLIIDKILKFVRCLDQIFRPLEDFLPLFFQFQAGLFRKQYNIPYDYISPYRPKQLKQYQKPPKKEVIEKKPTVELTKDENKRFQLIRQKIILVNEMITDANPSASIQKNQLLFQLMDQLKQAEKIINSTIDENPSEKILELALATNDDLVTTYRRFKDLQRNKKPEVFIMAQLASDIIKQDSIKQNKPKAITTKIQQRKIQPKPENKKFESIFQAFEVNSQKKIEEPTKKKQSEPQNIFDLLENSAQESLVSNISQVSDPFGLMDISQAQNNSTNLQNNSTSLDLMGNNISNAEPDFMKSMLSLNLGYESKINDPLEINSQMQGYQPPQNPAYQLFGLQQQQFIPKQNKQEQFFLNSAVLNQSPPQQQIYQNVTLKMNDQKQQKQGIHSQKALTDLSGSFKF